MKKVASLIVMGLMVLSLSGCGVTARSTGSDGGSDGGSSAPSVPPVAPVTYQLIIDTRTSDNAYVVLGNAGFYGNVDGVAMSYGTIGVNPLTGNNIHGVSMNVQAGQTVYLCADLLPTLYGFTFKKWVGGPTSPVATQVYTFVMPSTNVIMHAEY